MLLVILLVMLLVMSMMSITWPPDSTGSSFSFFAIGDVGRLRFATIGSWSGGIGSVGRWAAKFGRWLDKCAVEVKAEVDATVVEDAPEEDEVKTTFR